MGMETDGGDSVRDSSRYPALRRPCDRWFMRLLDGSSGLAGSDEWTKEMIDAVQKGQADNPEARVVLSELHRKFLRAGAAMSAPVTGDDLDSYYGESAAEFIRKGNNLYVEKQDDNWGDRVIMFGGEYGVVNELMMPKCDSKDVPLAALRSGFYLDKTDSRDWIDMAFEDLKAERVSLEEVRAALRDGCLNELGRHIDFSDSFKKYPRTSSPRYLNNTQKFLERGQDVQMYTRFGWPFGVKIPASSEGLPRSRFNLDTVGSKIPGIKGANFL